MNAGTSVQYAYENAPRDPKELALIGRFRLKDLAMKIGLGDTPETRSALTSIKVEDLAENVAQQLARMDAAAGGAPQVAAPAAPVAAPAAAAPAAPRRQPRPPAAAAAAPAAAAPAPGAPVVAAMPPEVVAQINQLAASNIALEKQLSTMALQINDLKGMLAETLFRQDLGTALSLFFAEETLGGARPEILQQALADLPDIAALVGKARQGGK